MNLPSGQVRTQNWSSQRWRLPPLSFCIKYNPSALQTASKNRGHSDCSLKKYSHFHVWEDLFSSFFSHSPEQSATTTFSWIICLTGGGTSFKMYAVVGRITAAVFFAAIDFPRGFHKLPPLWGFPKRWNFYRHDRCLSFLLSCGRSCSCCGIRAFIAASDTNSRWLMARASSSAPISAP